MKSEDVKKAFLYSSLELIKEIRDEYVAQVNQGCLTVEEFDFLNKDLLECEQQIKQYKGNTMKQINVRLNFISGLNVMIKFEEECKYEDFLEKMRTNWQGVCFVNEACGVNLAYVTHYERMPDFVAPEGEAPVQDHAVPASDAAPVENAPCCAESRCGSEAKADEQA